MTVFLVEERGRLMMKRKQSLIITLALCLMLSMAPVGANVFATTAETVYSQDGMGFSGTVDATPIGENIGVTGYKDWPEGFVKTSSSFFGGVFDGENIWLIPDSADRVIKINKATGSMTGYADWPGEPDEMWGGNLNLTEKFFGGIFDGENIWLIPSRAQKVVKINKDTGVMTGYDGWPTEISLDVTGKFNGGVFDGQYIWMIPRNNNFPLVKIDKDTGVMSVNDNWPEGFTRSSFDFFGAIFDGQSIWLIPERAAKIIKVDKDTGDMTAYDFPADYVSAPYSNYTSAVFDGEDIWFIPKHPDNTQLLKVNVTTGAVSMDQLAQSGYLGAAYDSESIWMVPSGSNKLGRYNRDTGVLTSFNAWPSDFALGYSSVFQGGIFDGENVWLIPQGADRVVKIGTLQTTYTIETIHDQTLTALTAGYASSAQTPQTINITNSGTGNLENITVAIAGGANPNAFSITQPAQSTLDSENTGTSFTVTAKDNLSIGIYEATVTVSADHMTDVSFNVTLAVNALTGDINGDGFVTPVDGLPITKYLSDKTTLTESEALDLYDVNGDNSVDINDVKAIMTIYLGGGVG